MKKAIKVRIYPTNDQQKYFANQFGCNRKVYNMLLDYRTAEYQNNKHFVTGKEQTQYFNKLKQELPYLQNVHSKVLQQTVRDLDDAFSRFWKRIKSGQNIGYPKFKSKNDNEQSCRFPSDMFNRSTLECKKIKGNRITLTKDLKDIHFKCSRTDEIFLNHNQKYIRSITCTNHKSGIYTLSILLDLPDNLIYKKKYNKVIGLDLGIKDFIVDSDGNRYENIQVKRSNKNKLRRLHRQLSRKDKGSNNRNKARIKLAKFYEKLTNKKNTYLHQISSKIINENQVICIEDLNVKGMMKNHNLALSIQELSLGEFKRQLEYKCKWYGRELIVIDRYYPSSKRCNVCGYINKELTLKDREWICPECGQVHNRDYNAALNIKDKGHMMYYLSGFKY